MLKPKIGPDGRFPFGEPQFEGDRGGLYVGMGRVPGLRYCFMDFGTTLEFVVTLPDRAVTVAASLRDIVEKHWGLMPYNVEELPIKVEAFEDRMVKMTLPETMELLVANPEVFLALAQRIDEAAMPLLRKRVVLALYSKT